MGYQLSVELNGIFLLLMKLFAKSINQNVQNIFSTMIIGFIWSKNLKLKNRQVSYQNMVSD